MQTLPEINGDELRWSKSRRSKLRFELSAGETVLATLECIGRYQAFGEWSDGGQYRFTRVGWFRPRTVISGATTDAAWQPVATFTHRASGGTLTFPDGRTFHWQKPKTWTTGRVWVDSTTTVLARFQPGNWRAPVNLTTTLGTTAPPELPLLLLLGQYLLVLASREAEDAITAATVAIIASS